jgi:hypothetical protein
VIQPVLTLLVQPEVRKLDFVPPSLLTVAPRLTARGATPDIESVRKVLADGPRLRAVRRGDEVLVRLRPRLKELFG